MHIILSADKWKCVTSPISIYKDGEYNRHSSMTKTLSSTNPRIHFLPINFYMLVVNTVLFMLDMGLNQNTFMHINQQTKKQKVVYKAQIEHHQQLTSKQPADTKLLICYSALKRISRFCHYFFTACLSSILTCRGRVPWWGSMVGFHGGVPWGGGGVILCVNGRRFVWSHAQPCTQNGF